MRKIFFFFAAMMVAITMNATPVAPGTDALSAAISAAADGATIELAAGDFIETADIDIAKNLTIKAADMSNKPVVKAKVFYPSGLKTIKFEGIKFDASAVKENLFSAADATNATILRFENCEFYGDTANAALITCGESYKLDSLIVNNCYFHNIKKSCIFLQNTGMAGLKVTNSTFANISTVADKYYAAPIQTKGTSTRVEVNNCTFYECYCMSSDYGAIGCRTDPSTNVLISNCIFALAVDNSVFRAIYVKGGYVKNCLTHHYKKSDNPYGIHSGPTITDCSTISNVDPLFADAANGNYTLNETSSPAKAAGVGGTHLGDPRWWPASWQPAEIVDVTSVSLDVTELTIDVKETAYLHATVLPDNATDPSVSWSSSNNAIATVDNGAVKGVAAGTVTITATAGAKSATCAVTVSAAIPSTDFATPYFLMGTKAELDGNIYISEADSLHYEDHSVCGNATWKINALTGGLIKATANYKKGSASGAILKLVILDKDDNQVGDTLRHDYYSKDGDKELSGSILLPEAGVYTIKLLNAQEYSSAKLKGITLTKADDVITLYLKAGVWHDSGAKFGIYVREEGWWPEFMTQVSGDLYSIPFPASKRYLNFVRFNGEADAPDDSYKWNDVVDLNRENDNNCMKITDWSAGQWRKYFPTLSEGYYLVGTHNSWEPTAADKMTVNPNNDNEFTIKKTVATGDQFKAISLDEDQLLGGWYPEGSGNEYTIPESLAGKVVIYFKPAGDNTWSEENGGGKKFLVVEDETTSISNTAADGQTVKFIQNGMLFIQKNGHVYNVLGEVVR